jgi:hypothetical protein
MMSSVAQFHDPMDDELVRRAELAGGAENLSEGERWRLQNVLERRRRQEGAGAQSGRATDALAAQRLAVIESWLVWLRRQVDEVLPEVIGTVISEAEQHSVAEAKKLLAEIRDETDQKLNAQYDGFERAVTQLRDKDRRALFENLREALGEAESRIDASFAKSLEAEKESNTIELALVRDEILNVIAEKTYAQPVDDVPKLELAEKAIAKLRRQVTSLEKDSARQAATCDQLTGLADRFVAFEDAYRKSTKSLMTRCAASALAAKKEAERADGLAGEVGRLRADLERLTSALLDQKVIR